MRRSPFLACALLLMVSCTPFAGTVAADSSILLDLDQDLVILTPGQATNVTLSVENNASSIYDFTIELGDSSAGLEWVVNLTATSMPQVYPYSTDTLDIVVSLGAGANGSDSGVQWIWVNRTGASSAIELHLSVGTMHLPDIDATGVGDNGLVTTEGNATLVMPIEVSNFGSVQDTILLSVGAEPDLGGFWANHSSNSTGSETGNETNNETGNETGDENGNSTSLGIDNLLLFGNSYTQQNSLDTILEDLGVTDAVARTSGGLTLDDHWSNVNTSAHSWNTTLRDPSVDWDYVILQDQSQIPGFPRSNSDWIESRDAALDLADAVEDESSEVVLMMTWGRRNGDVTNPTIYGNFTQMQDRLEAGYIDFLDNITAQGQQAWIAPVGLAFAHIHDGIVANGSNPLASGATFSALYSADGSHPSLAGSYLAALVIAATTSGQTTVGFNDSVSLPAALKLELQQAADATVFNETSHLSYPWETGSGSGTSMGMARNTPVTGLDASSWAAHWDDPVVRNLSSGSTTTVDLNVEVPQNAAPGAYGLRLYAASTFGNFSVSTVLVIDVNGTHIFESDFTSEQAWLPGDSGNLTMALTDVGTDGISPSIVPGSISTVGACLVDSINSVADVDSTWSIGLDILPQSHVGDSCIVSLDIHESESDTTHTLVHTIVVDESLTLGVQVVSALAQGPVQLPSGTVTLQTHLLTNNGTEDLNVSLSAPTIPGISFTSDTVHVPRGTTRPVLVEFDSVQSLTLNSEWFEPVFSTDRAGTSIVIDDAGSSNASVNVVYPHWTDISVSAINGTLVALDPGESTTLSFEIQNLGTTTNMVEFMTSTPPPGMTVTPMIDTFSVSSGEVHTLHVLFEADVESSAIDTSLDLDFLHQDTADSTDDATGDTSATDRISVSMVVNSRGKPLIGSGVSEIPVVTDLWTTVDITLANGGNAQGVFEISIIQSPNGLQTELSQSIVTLGVGQSTEIELSVKGSALGTIVVSASASSGPDYSSTVSFETISGSLAATLTVTPSALVMDDEVESLSAIVFNPTDRALDYRLEVTSELECALQNSALSVPAASSLEVVIYCSAPTGTIAGVHDVIVDVRPVDLPTEVTSATSQVTLPEAFGANGALLLDFVLLNDGGLIVRNGESLTMLIKVENTGNTNRSGILILSGDSVNNGLVKTWNVASTGSSVPLYNLAPGEGVTMELNLVSNGLPQGTYDIVLTASENGGVGEVSLAPLSLFIEDEPVPPTGIALPFGAEMDNMTSIFVLLGGYVLTMLLIQILRSTRRRSVEKVAEAEARADARIEAINAESESEPLIEEDPLEEGEVRPGPDGAVSCPFCDTRAKVPEGKTPPFRFRCPSCSEIVRVVE